MKKENYDDIQAMFDSDGVKLPNELFKENMVGKIKEKTGDKATPVRQFKPKRKFAAILSSAAVLALIVTAVTVSSSRIGKPSVSNSVTVPDTTATASANDAKNPTQSETSATEAKAENTDENELMTFKSEDEFVKFLTSKFSSSDTDAATNGSGVKSTVSATQSGNPENYAAAPMAPDESFDSFDTAASISSSQDNTSSKTNTQVDGVDEADIIKNDGRYLFVITDDTRLSVVDTVSMKTVFVKNLEAVNGGSDYTALEMYLTDNRLTVLGIQYKKTEDSKEGESGSSDGFYTCSDCFYPYYNYYDQETVVQIFDITDKDNISLVSSFTQDGYYQNSRLVDGYLYLITNYNIDTGDIKNTASPSVRNEKVTYDCIYVGARCESFRSQTVISGFSVSQDSPQINKISVVGNADEIYCTTDTLYIFSSSYSVNYDETDYTDIFSFCLKDGKIEKKETGSVPGTVDDNYSVDEKDSYLRIATTAYDYQKDVDISSIYTLDEKLEIVGKLVDIAHDEQVKSARFIGNTAYIVTFRNTDPLFAVDLSDPKNPKILGEVKLPGFSEYLHPIGENLLVGIGYDGDDDDADYQSLKITLFDVSDPLNPAVKDSLVFKYTDSNVLNNPKSFIVGQNGNDFYIPTSYEKFFYDIWGDWYKSSYTLKYLHLSAENGKLNQLAVYTVPDTFSDYVYDDFTGAYIGQSFYTVADDTVYQYNISSAENTAEASLRKVG
ncbi:MAG: beta-propeller domain-containing protein [Acutalibacteraceae bacterium]